MKGFYRSLLGLVVLVSVLWVGACHRSSSSAMRAADPHPLTASQRKLVSEIRASGASVTKQGEVLQIVMPTDRFFIARTTHIRRNRMRAVSRIALLVKSYIAPYRHPHISVSGHTDTVFMEKTRRRLSWRYAREVAAYLWHKGVPQRWVSIRGHGSKYPIASERTPRGKAYNRRVVVRVN